MNDNNCDLRQELQKLFSLSYNNEQIITELDKLKKSYKQNISVYQLIEDFEKEFYENFNCFEYALDLKTSGTYKKIRENLAKSYMRGIFCNSCFVAWLIDNKKLDPNVTNGMEVIIIYSNSKNEIKHAGIIKDYTATNESIIISKFGTGHVYEHPKLQVPKNYGNRTKIYKKPSLKDIEDCFKEYLKQLRSNIDEIVSA